MMEACQIAHADIAERIAVIGGMQGQKLRLFRSRFRTLPPELKRHLERDFDRRGAVIGKEHARQPRRRDLNKPAREFDAAALSLPWRLLLIPHCQVPHRGRILTRLGPCIAAPPAPDEVHGYASDLCNAA